jgi:DNA-binding FrmR family transcriptional regulator
MSDSETTAPYPTEVARKRMMDRLARTEGQVRAIRQLIGSGAPCEEVAHQMSSARSALDQAFLHMVACALEDPQPPTRSADACRTDRRADSLLWLTICPTILAIKGK